VELTYNYGVKHYKLGNDFVALTVKSTKAFAAAGLLEEHKDHAGIRTVHSPDGYAFRIINGDVSEGEDPVLAVTLHVSDLERSLGMDPFPFFPIQGC